MLISETTFTKITTQLAAITGPMKQTLFGSAVRLNDKSTPAKFNGSGVILYAKNGVTTIVSAKHNLYIFNGNDDAPAWDDAIVQKFQANALIKYKANPAFNSAPQSSAAITSVTPVTLDGTPSWQYDVMVLTSNDANLATYAATNSVYTPADEPDPDTLKFLTTSNRYLSKSQGALFIQVGFGKITDKVSKKNPKTMPTEKAQKCTSFNLQYRITEPSGVALKPVFGQDSDQTGAYHQQDEAIILSADANNSTAPGDSGGGLFVVQTSKKPPTIYLIGVNSGADMGLTKEQVPSDPKKLLENNIGTSLAHCYKTQAILF